MFENYYKNGFEIFDGSKYVDYFDMDVLKEAEWVKGREENREGEVFLKDESLVSPILNIIHREIGCFIVSEKFSKYQYRKNSLWKGVSRDLCDWHNDSYETQVIRMEEPYFNCFFLFYLSDMEKIKEGAINFKNTKTDEEWKIYPKIGTLIAVNSDPVFLHKPEPTTHERIVCSFFFELIK